jgi:hypothetical protein
MGIIRNFKSRLVDDVGNLHKRWSVQLSTLGSVLIALSQLAPQSYYDLPKWAQDAIPPSFVPWVGVGLVLSSVVAQALKQKNLQGSGDDKTKL